MQFFANILMHFPPREQVEHVASPAGDMLQFFCRLVVDELLLMQFFANISNAFFRPVHRQVEHVASPAGDRVTPKSSGFKTSGFKTSGFKTSGFKTSETSGLQNIRFTKCQIYKMSGLQNVIFPSREQAGGARGQSGR